MIEERDINEIRNKDFLKNKDHFRDFDDVETDLLFGRISKDKLFLSIIVPVYDHPIELILRAINSVLYQKCDYSYQILILDDNANSKRNDVLLEYIQKLNDPRFVYFKNRRNLGVFGNWNRGIELANSQWVTILHTDDFFKNNLLTTYKAIIDGHPEIDQLCCNYKMLQIKDKNLNIDKEYHCQKSHTIVRKVRYTEYFYEMKTSVKGSFYKKDKLVELGGFRSQGDGLGLDDYPLMLRYAYYYNTYLIEDVLYLDSWGYNDSLNTKHWFPELIANYYMMTYFAGKEKGIKRRVYERNAFYLLKKRAIDYDKGTSWVGIPVPIDFELLQDCCGVDFSSCNIIEEKLISFFARVFNYLYKHPFKKFNVTIDEGISLNTLRQRDFI